MSFGSDIAEATARQTFRIATAIILVCLAIGCVVGYIVGRLL